MPRSSFLLWSSALALVALAGCSCSSGVRAHHADAGVDGGDPIDAFVVPADDAGTLTPGDDAGPNLVGDSGLARSCAPDSPDLEGCGCQDGMAPRACWPYTIDPVYRGVGLCVDGTQDCISDGAEFSHWGPCGGEFAPEAEYCANDLDDNCDGTVDCLDPTCAGDPHCATGCTDGETRPCYTGPPRTLDVGICHAGTQTCVLGTWSVGCDGEQLPEAEDCSGPGDRNCNRTAGCFDLFACATSTYCQEHCADPLMPGCVCPDGTGDVATCPQHMHAVTMGTLGGTIQCCPCSASDCGDANCCNESFCSGSSWCSGFYCRPLPASCMGRVSADCDDFPEDCDEPCCECYGDCSGA